MDFSVLLQDIPTLLVVILGVPAILAAYIVGGEYLVRRLPDKNRPQVRPWIWVGPALILVAGYLLLPAIGTIGQSFENNAGNWVGFNNYASQFADFPQGGAWVAIRNNVIFWLIFYTTFTLAFGLVLAVLFDRVRYESLVKSLIFMPMAISSVALGIIWIFMYQYSPPGESQVGTLNAIITFFHHDPVVWLQDQWPSDKFNLLNNLALIGAATWGITGFSMVILSAALKGIPGELLEAARVDGAGELTVFRRVDDRRQLQHRRAGFSHVRAAVHRRQQRARERGGCDPADRGDTGADLQLETVPRSGGTPMTVAAAAQPTTVAARFSPGWITQLLQRYMLHVVVIGLTVAWMLPSIGLLVSSFRPFALTKTSGWWTALSPLEFTIQNYTDVLDQSNLGQAFFNSFMVSVPATVIPVTIGAFAAYAFAWMRFPARNWIFLALVGLLAVPLQLTFVPVLSFYVNTLHWTTSNLESIGIPGLPWVPLWLAHAGYGLPFSIYLLANFFRALPSDLFESAEIDGAGTLTVFFRIILPLSVPALASLVIFQFLWVWNDLLVALIYVGGAPEVAPLTVNLADLTTSLGQGSNLLTSAAFFSMIVPLIVFLSLQRYFVRGILAGSVKG